MDQKWLLWPANAQHKMLIINHIQNDTQPSIILLIDNYNESFVDIFSLSFYKFNKHAGFEDTERNSLVFC